MWIPFVLKMIDQKSSKRTISVLCSRTEVFYDMTISKHLGLNNLQSGVHRQYMKDLFVELCLTVPVRLRWALVTSPRCFAKSRILFHHFPGILNYQLFLCCLNSSLLPYLPMLMDPLVSALNGSQTLVSQVRYVKKCKILDDKPRQHGWHCYLCKHGKLV